MEHLSQILLELTCQNSRREYGLLCRAIEEAVTIYPAPPAMGTLCQRLADAGGGAEDPDALRRLLARAVDGLWKDPDIRLIFRRCGHWASAERPAPEDFIAAMARHLREQSLQAEEPPLYEITFDAACRKYGILIRAAGASPAASLPALTGDVRRLERVVRLLRRYRIPPEVLKEDYLSGGGCGLNSL